MCVLSQKMQNATSSTFVFPQIALAIGVLTSNRRGGSCTSSIAGLPLLAAIAGYCWGWGGGCRRWRIGRGGAAIAGDRRRGGCTRWRIGCGAVAGCHYWVPLLGIGGGGCTSWRIGCGDVAAYRCWVPLLGCHCWVPLLGIGGGCTRWRIGRGAVAGCHCSAAIAACHRWGGGGG